MRNISRNLLNVTKSVSSLSHNKSILDDLISNFLKTTRDSSKSLHIKTAYFPCVFMHLYSNLKTNCIHSRFNALKQARLANYELFSTQSKTPRCIFKPLQSFDLSQRSLLVVRSWRVLVCLGVVYFPIETM